LISLFIGCDKDNGVNNEPEPEIKKGDIYVDIYNSEKACYSTTIFADLHDPQNPRIIEVNMQGEIIWEYKIPDNLKRYNQPGLDVELFENGNILFVLPGKGVYEIDRSGSIVWFHLDNKISHDADRLANENTIYVYGNNDGFDDAEVKEVNPQGEIVWAWHAKDHYNTEPYINYNRQGWIHTNAITRLDNGNTLINLRNFSLTIEVNPQGEIVWEFDWTSLYPTTHPYGLDPHEPVIHSNNHILICLQWDTPYQVVELDRNSGRPVWEYHRDKLRTARDCDRLPNGNTLIVGVLEDTNDSVIFEVTSEREIVWQLKVKNTPAINSPGWFYKAQRVCQ